MKQKNIIFLLLLSLIINFTEVVAKDLNMTKAECQKTDIDPNNSMFDLIEYDFICKKIVPCGNYYSYKLKLNLHRLCGIQSMFLKDKKKQKIVHLYTYFQEEDDSCFPKSPDFSCIFKHYEDKENQIIEYLYEGYNNKQSEHNFNFNTLYISQQQIVYMKEMENYCFYDLGIDPFISPKLSNLCFEEDPRRYRDLTNWLIEAREIKTKSFQEIQKTHD